MGYKQRSKNLTRIGPGRVCGKMQPFAGSWEYKTQPILPGCRRGCKTVVGFCLVRMESGKGNRAGGGFCIAVPFCTFLPRNVKPAKHHRFDFLVPDPFSLLLLCSFPLPTQADPLPPNLPFFLPTFVSSSRITNGFVFLNLTISFFFLFQDRGGKGRIV